MAEEQNQAAQPENSSSQLAQEQTNQPTNSSLQAVKEQQARRQNQEVTEERVDTSVDIPGHSVPSEIRKHPQRKLG